MKRGVDWVWEIGEGRADDGCREGSPSCQGVWDITRRKISGPRVGCPSTDLSAYPQGVFRMPTSRQLAGIEGRQLSHHRRRFLYKSGTASFGTAEPGARRPCWGRVQGGGRPLPPRGSGGITPGKFLTFFKQNPAFWCTSERK
jgi:hypothetical protein